MGVRAMLTTPSAGNGHRQETQKIKRRTRFPAEDSAHQFIRNSCELWSFPKVLLQISVLPLTAHRSALDSAFNIASTSVDSLGRKVGVCLRIMEFNRSGTNALVTALLLYL
jgi:hypothetical protein